MIIYGWSTLLHDCDVHVSPSRSFNSNCVGHWPLTAAPFRDSVQVCMQNSWVLDFAFNDMFFRQLCDQPLLASSYPRRKCVTCFHESPIFNIPIDLCTVLFLISLDLWRGKRNSESLPQLKRYNSSTLEFTTYRTALLEVSNQTVLKFRPIAMIFKTHWPSRDFCKMQIFDWCEPSSGLSCRLYQLCTVMSYLSYHDFKSPVSDMKATNEWSRWEYVIFKNSTSMYSIHWSFIYNPKTSRATCVWYVMTCVLQRYLAELVLAQQPLPRRQEAESLEFTSGGITQSALVTHKEVQEWATGSRKAIMCSISHAWETREHPDPCRQGTG